MNIADLFIGLFFVSSLIRGVELGLIQQFFSTTGFLCGLFLGGLLQHQFIQPVSDQNSRAMLSLVVVLGVAFIFLFLGEFFGGMIKMRLRVTGRELLHKLDRIGGSIIAGITLLVVVWLLSGLVSSVPQDTVQKQVRESYIVRQLNGIFPDAPKVLTRLGNFINPNGFPTVFVGNEPALNLNTPLPDLGQMQAGVQAARGGVVKIAGEGCGGTTNGSGFLAARGLVVTNAHVVAGVGNPRVIDSTGSHSASAIWFNPDLDLAILRSNAVDGKVLPMLAETAPNGTPSAALGFPGGGDFTASLSTVLDSFTATGRNIYDQGTTRRNVYSLKTSVQPGNSGGPLINKDGTVIGLIFAASTSYENVGYALTMQQVLDALTQAQAENRTVGTGTCAP